MSQHTMQRIKDFFGAALPVVSLSSPSAEEYSTLEQLYFEVAKKLKLPLYCFDLGAGLRQVEPAAAVRYRLPNGELFEGEPFSKDGELWTSDHDAAVQLTEEFEQLTGVAFKPISTAFKHPVLNIFQFIEQHPKGGIFVLIDFHAFIDGDHKVWEASRYLKHLAIALKQSHKRIVLMSQDGRLSQDFSGLVYEVHATLPGLADLREAISLAIDDLSKSLSTPKKPFIVDLSAEERETLYTSCRGLTIEESLNAIRITGRSRRRIDNQTAQEVTQFKIEKLEKLNIKFSPAPDIQPGGLDHFKAWIKQRRSLFHASINREKRNLQLPVPKGCLIVGFSGTGKSLLAKTLGNAWNVPILQVDIGSFYSSLVGETEKNFRNFTRLVDNLGPVVLLLDEIEKGLGAIAGGATSGDSGVSQRLFGAFLTWLNDKTSPVFVVATANDISALPPEFSRKGRFDEIWFVDAPNRLERAEILRLHLARHNSDSLGTEQLAQLVSRLENYVGAEIKQVVDEAAILAASEGGDQIVFSHLMTIIDQSVPHLNAKAEAIASLRAWAEVNARYASPKDEPEFVPAPSQTLKTGKPQLLMEDEDE